MGIVSFYIVAMCAVLHLCQGGTIEQNCRRPPLGPYAQGALKLSINMKKSDDLGPLTQGPNELLIRPAHMH